MQIRLQNSAWSQSTLFAIHPAVLDTSGAAGNKIDWSNFNPCPAEPRQALLCKQCRSRSVGFWRSQLIWICNVWHLVCEVALTTWIKHSNWLRIRYGHGILIYSACQGLKNKDGRSLDIQIFRVKTYVSFICSMIMNCSVNTLKISQENIKDISRVPNSDYLLIIIQIRFFFVSPWKYTCMLWVLIRSILQRHF